MTVKGVLYFYLRLSRQRNTIGCACRYTKTLPYVSNTRQYSSIVSIKDSLQVNNHQVSYNLQRPPPVELKWEYLLDPANKDVIQENILVRKGVGCIVKLNDLFEKYRNLGSLSHSECIQSLRSTSQINEEEEFRKMREEIIRIALEIPNGTHPDTPIGDESSSTILEHVGILKDFNFQPKGVVELGHQLKFLRTEHNTPTTGPRSYYFIGDFAKLQDALVDYTIDTLTNVGFKLVYVPEMIHPSTIEACGFKTTGIRHQVYHLFPSNDQHVCLAGTGEMPLAGLHLNKTFEMGELPRKLMTVSRCYRSEVSEVDLEKGIYRVHQFIKVEMFGITTGLEESEKFIQEFLDIQRRHFAQLGLHFRILRMSSAELGAPAYCKYDMEAWMYDKRFWGEISSTSNCTDFQSRRLGLRYRDEKGQLQYAHTINGTACAVPRLTMAIAEQNQTLDGNIEIPTVLQPYMGKTVIKPAPANFHCLTPVRLRGHVPIQGKQNRAQT